MVYEKECTKCATKLKDEIVCLSLDGWSNIHNEPIICATVTTSNGHIYLVDTTDTSGQPHTAEYLAELSESVIQKCKEELGCHVGSVVTDNAANVNKMRKLLEHGNELKLVTYGCTAQILNLLARDLEIGNIKEHVVYIVKYFRNNHYASARYRQEGGQRLVMPQDARWNTMCNCLKIYIKNWPVLMTIWEVDREQIDVRVREMVSNLTLKRSAENLLARLEPIAVALDIVQNDKCTIAEAVNIWKELITTLCNDRDAVTAAKKRFDQVITQAHLLANLIHPSFQGKLLSAEEVNNAMDYANEKFPSLVPVIMKLHQIVSFPFV
ncbi:uncharacterized protein [Macrobrachium rosenbergii]|uniref:uncharacterized protein isoform X1 n=1 Tax=Macrobrachium rosenbergii TaxID=79674 RepID=UPI0034D3B869